MIKFLLRMTGIAAAAGAVSTAVAVAPVAAAVVPPAHSLSPAVPQDHVRAYEPSKATLLAHEQYMAVTAPARYVTVQAGDTLWGIAGKMLGGGDKWPKLYASNKAVIGPDPNYILPGERLRPVLATRGSFGGSAPVAVPARPSSSEGEDGSRQPGVTASGTVTSGSVSHLARYSCSDLEHLWESEGGNPADAFIAAEVAMAESGGDPNAISPTNDYGLWQINASNGALATLDPAQNARSAVILSHDGTDWSPWTTYTSGAYQGRC